MSRWLQRKAVKTASAMHDRRYLTVGICQRQLLMWPKQLWDAVLSVCLSVFVCLSVCLPVCSWPFLPLSCSLCLSVFISLFFLSILHSLTFPVSIYVVFLPFSLSCLDLLTTFASAVSIILCDVVASVFFTHIAFVYFSALASVIFCLCNITFSVCQSMCISLCDRLSLCLSFAARFSIRAASGRRLKGKN